MVSPIVLVNFKTDRILHPLSVLCVGSALKRAGFEVKILNVIPEEIDAAVEEILGLSPLFIGFSVFTGLYTKIAAVMSEKLKENNCLAPIVWGGVHPSIMPEQCLKESFVDIVVIGEGEETAVELAKSLNTAQGLTAIKGIGFKSKGEIVLNAPRPLAKNIDANELDWSLVDIKDCVEVTSSGTRYLPYISSRGCPFNCGFCYNLAFNKRVWRPLSIEYVKKEILRLKKLSGVDGIAFNDDNFMVDIPRALQILEFLRDNGIKCGKLEMRLDLLDEKILDTIIDLGVTMVFIAWESGSDRILKLINKGITRQEILEKFKLLSRFPNLGVCAPAIIGFPTETWKESCQTIDLGLKIAELVPSNMITFQTYLPYPGTDLYPIAIKEGLIPPERSIDWGGYNTFYGDMKLEWLPWATKSTPRIFYRIDKYGKLLNHGPSTSILRTWGKKACYFLAHLRLRHRFFSFPVEIHLLHRLNRYYLDIKGKPIKR